MSLPNHLLEEPDLCEQHGRYIPCLECMIEYDEQRADWKHDEREERT